MAIKKLCAVFDVASVGKAEIISAANISFDDFEDALQIESAKLAEVDYIITRDSDFQNSAIPCLSPRQFIGMKAKNVCRFFLRMHRYFFGKF